MADIISKLFGSANLSESDVREIQNEDSKLPIGPESTERFKGQITKLNPNGWGFINSREVPFTRIFFHWTSLTQDTLRFPALRERMTVEFNTVEVPERGTRATKLRVIDETPKLTE
jgi:hypothetical protein